MRFAMISNLKRLDFKVLEMKSIKLKLVILKAKQVSQAIFFFHFEKLHCRQFASVFYTTLDALSALAMCASTTSRGNKFCIEMGLS